MSTQTSSGELLHMRKGVRNFCTQSTSSYATGPPTQATGAPRSGAGVGVDMLRGAGVPLLEMKIKLCLCFVSFSFPFLISYFPFVSFLF